MPGDAPPGPATRRSASSTRLRGRPPAGSAPTATGRSRAGAGSSPPAPTPTAPSRGSSQAGRSQPESTTRRPGPRSRFDPGPAHETADMGGRQRIPPRAVGEGRNPAWGAGLRLPGRRRCLNRRHLRARTRYVEAFLPESTKRRGPQRPCERPESLADSWPCPKQENDAFMTTCLFRTAPGCRALPASAAPRSTATQPLTTRWRGSCWPASRR